MHDAAFRLANPLNDWGKFKPLSMLRVQRFRRFWDRTENDYRTVSLGADGWLSRQGQSVSIPVSDGTVTLSWETQASNGNLIYARLTYQQDKRGLLRPVRRGK